jgi:hypothetical protein
MITVKHSGNVGDIIYSLPVVMHLSKLENKKIKFYLNPIDNRMSLELANVLKPLLEHQDYIESVEIYNNEYIDHDLDLFRTMHTPSSNLGELHAKVFDYDFSILNEQSIFINDSYNANLPVYDIIINRTERYNNLLFPWQDILNTNFENHSKCFVGTRSEYELFIQSYGFSDIDYIPTTDFLQVAWLIKNSKIFIGNCSSPYAIAETMKHTSIQESCQWCLTCLYKRPNAYYFINEIIQL